VAVHLAWLGPEGLRKVGEISSALAHSAAERIVAETAFRVASTRPFVRELALRGPKEADEVVVELRHRGIWAGPCSTDHADVFNVAFTERRTEHDIDALVEALREVGKL
jgi:glycine dehydrogenase subunit 1